MPNEQINKKMIKQDKELQEKAHVPYKSKLEILMEILCEKKILTEEERQDILKM
jgi:hypothetical protein